MKNDMYNPSLNALNLSKTGQTIVTNSLAK